MKIELKHITTYLPYELMVNLLRKGFERYNVPLRSFELRYNPLPEWGYYIMVDNVSYSLSDIQLILQPLSQYKDFFGKPISDLGGDVFVTEEICRFAEQEISLASVSYSSYSLMAENKVDMFGLIDAGLAIDANKLNAHTVTKFKNL